jgi:WXXGXW repeat (2 copies)
MKRFDWMIGIAAPAFVAAAVSGCSAPSQTIARAEQAQTAQAATIAAPYPPPPQLAEIPPPAPAPDALWHFGHWSWTGAKYLWSRGHYIERPTPTANWSQGYWQQGADGWVWVEGRWT